jgi:hypothetical protein
MKPCFPAEESVQTSEEKIMKGLLYAAATLALLSVPAFAGAKTQRQTITFSNPVTVGTASFVPGDCRVSWDDTGDTVQVTLTQKANDASVTVPAKVVKGDFPHRSLVLTTKDAGQVLTAIQFNHYSLVLNGTEMASESAPKTNQ